MNHHRILTGLAGCVLSMTLSLFAAAGERGLKITVSAGEHDRENTPVKVKLPSGALEKAAVAVALVSPDGKLIIGQAAGPGLIDGPAGEKAKPGSKEGGGRYLHFVLPRLKAGKSVTFEATKAQTDTIDFLWKDKPDEYSTLFFGERPVLRYMYQKLDETTPQSREQTYKVFHHLFDPKGKQIVTKGPGGKYTHHRGLFYGFNRISYDGGKKKADIWHCRGDAYQSHEKFVSQEAGPVFGRHRVQIAWHGAGKEVFAVEEREMTVYAVPGGQLVEFASRLSSKAGPVRLDGDPQHAGFQFRASNEVAEKTSKQTYYLRPDGKGKPGETRNWDAKSRNTNTVNLPWNAMSFVLGNQRFTAVYLDHPKNPKEARYSERDYGRFGSYFEYDLEPSKALELNYRIGLQAGEMTADEARSLHADFTLPLQVTIAR